MRLNRKSKRKLVRLNDSGTENWYWREDETFKQDLKWEKIYEKFEKTPIVLLLYKYKINGLYRLTVIQGRIVPSTKWKF